MARCQAVFLHQAVKLGPVALTREVNREKKSTRFRKPPPEAFETAVNQNRKRALIVGINRYEREPNPPVSSNNEDLREFDLPQPAHRFIPYRRRFAERDAVGLAEELQRHGFEVRTRWKSCSATFLSAPSAALKLGMARPFFASASKCASASGRLS